MAVNLEELSFSELKVLSALIEQRKRQVLAERKQEVRRRLTEVARSEGFSIGELFGGAVAGMSRSTYANPANPFQAWGGRGKRPQWLVDALAMGKTLEDLKLKA